MVALWRLSRPKGAVPESSQADAIAAGFFCEILRKAAGKDWNSGEIFLVLPNPSPIASSFFPPSSVIGGAEGMTLWFPSDMLNLDLAPLPEVPLPDPISPIQISGITLADRVGELLASNLSNPGFGVADTARMFGLKRWRLQVLPSKEGTSVTELKNKMRRQLAIQSLRENEDPISVISNNPGYSNRANFSRAVRSWTGLSPQAFRAKNRK